jgi:hypothetical protein
MYYHFTVEFCIGDRMVAEVECRATIDADGDPEDVEFCTWLAGNGEWTLPAQHCPIGEAIDKQARNELRSHYHRDEIATRLGGYGHLAGQNCGVRRHA